MRAVSSRIALAAALALATPACDDDPPSPSRPARCLGGQDIIPGLQRAYGNRDLAGMATLLHPDFRYALEAETLSVEIDRTSWLRIHQRMFDPQRLPPEEALPPESWVVDIQIALSPQDEFAPIDLPGGLEPERWRAFEALHVRYMLIRTQGGPDRVVDGRAAFTVVEDRTKQTCEPGKYWLYGWQDLETPYWLEPWAGPARWWIP